MIMRKIDKIIVHCTATPLDTSFASIKAYHVRDLGYKDIGYHYLINKLGVVLPGRPLEDIGAHCRGYNECSIGIALIGGQYRFDFTFQQIVSLRNLVRKLCKDYNLSFDNVLPHYKFASYKSCPQFDVQNLIC